MYKAGGAQPGADATGAASDSASGSQSKGGDDVIDADFKDVN